MPDYRSLSLQKVPLKPISFSGYKVVHNSKSRGFKVVLEWEYDDRSVMLFRVFKAKVGADLLKKDYEVDNLTLQRYTQKKGYPLENKILYDKNLFVENNSVKFKSESTAFKQKSMDSSTVSYSFFKSTRRHPSGKYKMTDYDVKFGETYYYQIFGVSNDLREVQQLKPLLVTIEDFSTVQPPEVVKHKITPEGISFCVGNTDQGEKIRAYDFFVKTEDEEEYSFLFRAEKNEIGDFVNFIHGPEEIYKKYSYKIFSVNLFNEKSLHSTEYQVYYNPISKRNLPSTPKVEILRDGNALKILVYKIENCPSFSIKRRDVSLYEKGFSLKTRNGIFWDSTIQFKEQEFVEFIDFSVDDNLLYQYQIEFLGPAYTKDRVYVSPILSNSEGLFISNFEKKEKEDEKLCSMGPVDVSIKDKKRSPAIVRFDWTNQGSFDFYEFDFLDYKKVKIDGIYNNAILEFPVGKKFICTLRGYKDGIERCKKEGIIFHT